MNGTHASPWAGQPPAAVSLKPHPLCILFALGPTIPAKPLPNTMFKLASLHPKHETRSLLLIEALRASEPFGLVCAHTENWAQPHGRACDYLENERRNEQEYQ